MITVISIALTILFVIFCSGSLKKHPVPYYIGAAVAAAAVFILQLTKVSLAFPPFISEYIWLLFFRGGIAGAMFVTIMWTGAAPVRSKRMKKLMPVRGELSIIASILGIGHGAANALTYFRMLFTQPSRMSAVTAAFTWCSIIMSVIMLPLFITSFKTIRRKMKAASWKKLQRTAYVFYGLMFAHVSLLYIPYILQGKDYWLSYILYCFIFVSYAICRTFKAILKNVNIKMLRMQIAGNVIAVIITVLVFSLLLTNVRGEAAEKTVKQTAAEQSMKAVQEGFSAAETAPAETDFSGTAVTEASAEAEKLAKNDTHETAGSGTPEAPENELESGAEQETAGEEPEAEADAGKYNDGTYYGTGEGYEGTIAVSVTIENDVITWIEPGENVEDPEFFVPALAVLAEVLDKQHTDLDAVSGATFSSYGLLDAVDDALSQAKK